MACADDALNTQEQQYTPGARGRVRRSRCVGDRLSLFRADGGYAVVFERA